MNSTIIQDVGNEDKDKSVRISHNEPEISPDIVKCEEFPTLGSADMLSSRFKSKGLSYYNKKRTQTSSPLSLSLLYDRKLNLGKLSIFDEPVPQSLQEMKLKSSSEVSQIRRRPLLDLNCSLPYDSKEVSIVSNSNILHRCRQIKNTFGTNTFNKENLESADIAHEMIIKPSVINPGKTLKWSDSSNRLKADAATPVFDRILVNMNI